MIKDAPATEAKAMRLLCCDGNGCGRKRSFHGVGSWAWSSSQMRAVAKQYGWSSSPIGNNLDFCPVCVKRATESDEVG